MYHRRQAVAVYPLVVNKKLTAKLSIKASCTIFYSFSSQTTSGLAVKVIFSKNLQQCTYQMRFFFVISIQQWKKRCSTSCQYLIYFAFISQRYSFCAFQTYSYTDFVLWNVFVVYWRSQHEVSNIVCSRKSSIFTIYFGTSCKRFFSKSAVSSVWTATAYRDQPGGIFTMKNKI